MVQGVGFRYFAQDGKLADGAKKVGDNTQAGADKSTNDATIESPLTAKVAPQQHAEFCAMLERGPRFSNVKAVHAEPATPDPRYEGGFVIVPSD